MDDKPKIRNAFVVDPEGNVQAREMPGEIAPLVDNLEKLHNALLQRKHNQERK